MSYFDEHEPTMRVDVLGTEYVIYTNVSPEDDPILLDCSGYCDKTMHRVVIIKPVDTNLGDWHEYEKTCIRHELVHAFLFESGISGDTLWDIEGQEHPEHMVEWIAMQFPKMIKAFQAVGAL